MKKKAFIFGRQTAKSLFDVGNSFNFAKSVKLNNSKQIFIRDDFSALESDWKSVGKEVELALEEHRSSSGRKTIGTFP